MQILCSSLRQLLFPFMGKAMQADGAIRGDDDSRYLFKYTLASWVYRSSLMLQDAQARHCRAPQVLRLLHRRRVTIRE